MPAFLSAVAAFHIQYSPRPVLGSLGSDGSERVAYDKITLGKTSCSGNSSAVSETRYAEGELSLAPPPSAVPSAVD